jgi:autotransporter-associated beta strand protein
VNNTIKVRSQYATNFLSRGLILVTVGLAMALAAHSAYATSETWTGGGANALWSTTNNWGSTAPVPGFGDSATFNSAGDNNTNVDLGAGVTISNITFDTSAAPYTIGTGGSETLNLQSNGAITVTLAVANPQVLDATIDLGTNAAGGSYFISNNSTQLVTVLGTIQGASGGTMGSPQLYLGGSGSMVVNNTANNGGTLSIRKVGSGTLTLAGSVASTGNLIISNGTAYINGTYSVGQGALCVGTTNGVGPIPICYIGTNAYVFLNNGGGGNVYIGNGNQDTINEQGVLIQNGGSITVAQNLMIGRNSVNTAQAYGFYNLKGGNFHHTGTNRLRIGQGDGGPGTAYLLYITGTGSMTVDAVGIGLNDNANSAGGGGGNPAILYVASGGYVTNAASGIGLGIGGKTTGTTNVVTIADSGTMVLIGSTGLGASVSPSTAGNNSGRVGYLNINNGGSLQTSQVYLDVNLSPVGYANFNGGTLKAQGGTTTFMGGLTRAIVYGGGLTFDDNGTNIAIAQPLLAPIGKGVLSIAVSNATGYIGAPFVKIAGGGATEVATAVALIDGNGNVTNIEMTSYGDGYTSLPTVTLVAPFGTPGTLTPALTTGSLTPSGGLTKKNTGTLTLSGANTYTGLTTVASGAMMLAGGALGGPVSVGSGYTFGGNGTINGSVTLSGNNLLALSNGVGAPLTINNGTLTLNGGTINFELGARNASDSIAINSGSLSVSGTTTINASALGGFNAGNYSLITGGSLPNANNFVLGAVPNATYTYALTNASGNLVLAVGTTNAALSAFWWGNASASWTALGNWANDINGTGTTAYIPSVPTAVTFTTTNANTGNLGTTLGADFEIASLTFITPNTVSIGGAYSLTVDSALAVSNGAGAVTISGGSMTAGFSQTWLNNSLNSFTVNEPINGAGSQLTFAGSGTTTLSGTNSYSGGTVVSNSGTLLLNVANALNSAGSVTVQTGNLDIGANIQTVGAVTLNTGTIAGTGGGSLSSSSGYTVLGGGTVSAILGGTGGFTMTGTNGTVTLTASNTFTGTLYVDAGTLVLPSGASVDITGGSSYTSIGHTGTDNGTLNVQGTGSFGGSGDFNVGDIGASKGTLNLQDNGAVTVYDAFIASANGNASTAQGVVNQSGGTFTTTGSNLDPAFSIGGRASGTGNAGSGVYNLNGGALWVLNGGNAFIGGYGTGSFNVNGGTAVFSNYVAIARYASTASTQPPSVGTLTVNAGTVIQANPNVSLLVGQSGTGTLVVANSGSLLIQGNNGLVVADAAGALGTVNLNGGTITTTQVNKNTGGPGGTNGTAIFNFNGGVLQAGGNSGTFMTGLDQANVLSNGAVLNDGGFVITIGQALTDGGNGGGLTKQGAGTVQLTGTNTYNGPTTVSAGRLSLLAAQTGTGAVSVADSAVVRVSAATAPTQWQPSRITLGSSTGGSIEFNAISSTTTAPVNVATFTLNGTDPIKIIGGVFQTNTSYPLLQYTTQNGGGTYTFRPPGGMTGALSNNNHVISLFVQNIGVQLWKGNVNNNWDIETTTNWTVSSIPTVYGDGGPVQFDNTASQFSVSVVSQVLPSGVILSNSTTYTFSGAPISGLGTLTMVGNGTVIMGNTNTYTGNTTLNSGTFRLAANNVIPGGTGNGDVILNGTLDLYGNSDTIGGLSGNGTVDSTVAGSAVLTVGADNSSTIFSGVVQNTAQSLALVKIGTGAFTMFGNNTYSGGTTLSNGQLNIDSPTALGSGTLTINGGTIDNTIPSTNAITEINNNPQIWNAPFTYAGSITDLNLGAGPVYLPGNGGTSTAQVTVAANTLTVGGTISGNLALILSGGGTLSLPAQNTFAGDMFIANGTLLVNTIGNNFGPGGPGQGQYINLGAAGDTGTLMYNGPGEYAYKQFNLYSTGSGGINQSGSGTLYIEDDATVTGTGTHTFYLTGSGPGTGQVDGVIHDYISGTTTGATGVTKDGPGAWILTGANANTGTLSIRNGSLIVQTVGYSNQVSDLGAFNTINLGGGLTTGTLVYVGNGEISDKIIRIAAGATNPAGGAIIDIEMPNAGSLDFLTDVTAGSAPQAHLFTLQGSNVGYGQLNGSIPDNATNFPTSLLKTGPGLWNLLGTNNTYTGSTTVNNGTLALLGNCTMTNTPSVNVISPGILDVSGLNAGGMTFVAGQTLHGCGTVKGAVTIANGATLAPGCSPSTLTIMGSLVLGNSSFLYYGLGSSSDQAAVSGNLTLGGSLTVTNLGGFAAGNNYTLISYSGSLVNNGLTVNPLPGGLTGTITAGSGAVVLHVGAGADPYTSWGNHYGLSGQGALGTTDLTGDGMNNTNKFMAGFNPTNAAAYLHIINVARTNNNTDINVTYLGASGDTTYTGGPATRTNVLEFTTGTANGSYSNSFASTGQTNILGVGLSANGGSGLGTVTNMVDSGGATNKPSRFYRVRVLLP